MKDIIFPPSLRPGDAVAIISPASEVNPAYIDGAVRLLEKGGWRPVVFPYAKGPADGAYASSLENRLRDFITAWTDPRIRTILCSRGGYGAMQLLPEIPLSLLRGNPKWLVGFSDISALHAMLLTAGIASFHAPMAKDFTRADECGEFPRLFPLLTGATDSVEYRVEGHPLNIPGEASGRLRGGNLAVLSGLAATPFDILKIGVSEDVVLFIEDVGEALYRVDRMLWRLRLSGALSRIKGLVVGSFTEWHPDKNFPDAETMISERLRRWGIDVPVAFGFPVGHTDRNVPLVQGASVKLTVTPEGAKLKMEMR